MPEYQIGFAIHQMKRGREFRDSVVAPAGYTYVEFDAAGQEFRWMAIASGDTTMLQLCLPGEDPHSFMGARINPEFEYRQLITAVEAGDKEAKNTRQGGKVSNLSLQYRTSAARLRITARVDYGMDMTLQQANRNHFIYQRTYTGVPKYWDRQIAETREKGYVETFAGRRIKVQGDWSGKFGWSMGSTAINYRIQGTGADQKYLGLSVLRDPLLQNGGRFSFDLHDGLYFLVPDARAAEFARVAKDKLDSLPYQDAWGITPPIPMPWDCKMGKSWGTLEGVKFHE